MKKIININFQGRVLPIEEPSYEILKNYIESLRVYFANEEGRDEIINDIESRIAELFSEHLKTTACITDEEVNKVITSMGRPSDFEEAEATGNYTASGSKAQPGDRSYNTGESRKFTRSLNEKIVGGVCGGLANYLKIDPAMVRIIFVLLACLSLGTGVLLYAILWIILPGQVQELTISKRLFRSTDDRMIGGVAGGLGAYLNTAPWLIRFLLLLPLLLGVTGGMATGFLGGYNVAGIFGLGSGLEVTLAIIYIILWVILPEAKTASAKLQMKGEKINLASIKNTVQEDSSVATAPRRNNSSGLGKAIGILFKVFFLCIAGIAAIGMITVLMAILFGGMIGGASVFPLKDFILENSWQEVLAWGSLVLFLGIPAIALLTWLIRRMMGVRSKRHYLGYVFGTLWLLGLISAIVLLVMTARNFSTGDSIEEAMKIAAPSGNKLYITTRDERLEPRFWRRSGELPVYGDHNDSLFLSTVRFEVTRSADSAFHVYKIKFANAATRPDARQLASRINFTATQADSILTFERGFFISNKDKFRNQKVLVVIEVPVGKKIAFNRNLRSYDWFSIGFNHWNNDFHRRNGFYWEYDKEYTMTADGLKEANDMKRESDDPDEAPQE